MCVLHCPKTEGKSAHDGQDSLPDMVSESLEAELEVEEAPKNEDDDCCDSSCTSEVHRRRVVGDASSGRCLTCRCRRWRPPAGDHSALVPLVGIRRL
jgi:hypothetical protein